MTETQRDTLIEKIEAANLCSPAEVADAVLACETFELAQFELARAIEADLIETANLK